MDLGWVGISQVGVEEVRTSRWTPRHRSTGTTGGTSGSTSMSLKLSDSFRKSKYESGMVKGGFSFNSKTYLHMSQLTTQGQKSFESHLSSTLMRVKLVFY